MNGLKLSVQEMIALGDMLDVEMSSCSPVAIAARRLNINIDDRALIEKSRDSLRSRDFLKADGTVGTFPEVQGIPVLASPSRLVTMVLSGIERHFVSTCYIKEGWSVEHWTGDGSQHIIQAPVWFETCAEKLSSIFQTFDSKKNISCELSLEELLAFTAVLNRRKSEEILAEGSFQPDLFPANPVSVRQEIKSILEKRELLYPAVLEKPDWESFSCEAVEEILVSLAEKGLLAKDQEDLFYTVSDDWKPWERLFLDVQAKAVVSVYDTEKTLSLLRTVEIAGAPDFLGAALMEGDMSSISLSLTRPSQVKELFIKAVTAEKDSRERTAHDKCPRCDAETQAQDNYCWQCGEKLS
ncbi:MAG: zinc ribbon domain-containing protein [Candidatus Aureabacteria bacterium]|nr:zinc ribbon domain-containing protein [Candidatus Auribacterota bacterium]